MVGDHSHWVPIPSTEQHTCTLASGMHKSDRLLQSRLRLRDSVQLKLSEQLKQKSQDIDAEMV